MMLNLFTIFDPYMGLYNFNWLSTLIIIFLTPMNYWLYKSRWISFVTSILSTLSMEFKLIMMTNFNVFNLIIFIWLMINILINNLMGLFPYIFTSTSHLIFSLMFSLSMWLGLMSFGWIMNTNFMFSHLVPKGTPLVLMFFMVLIETLSNIIRPMTLAIRLMANMVAGHLLLTLLSSITPTILSIPIILSTQIFLFTLELAVSLIQSYVFMILITLYFKETN